MMNLKFVILIMVLSVGLMTNAYAHKSEVVGDYKIEVGWDMEPPLSEVNNKITLMITYAYPEEKTEADATAGNGGITQYGEGVGGLAQTLDVAVTLNKEKTTLTMIEDQTIPGLYKAEFLPRTEGYPIIHIFTEIDGKPIEIDFHPERVEDGAIIRTTTADGSVNVDVLATAPKIDRWVLIKTKFTDAQGNAIERVNYDIIAMQNGKQILSKNKLHAQDGEAKHVTEIVGSTDLVDIQITILGIGLPDDEANWSGPKGETVSLNVVPEFGLLVMIIFATAIIGIAAMSRSKSVPRFC
jgi:predicted secreted protein with PEFG-CTERM motif